MIDNKGYTLGVFMILLSAPSTLFAAAMYILSYTSLSRAVIAGSLIASSFGGFIAVLSLTGSKELSMVMTSTGNLIRKHVLGKPPYCRDCGDLKVQSGYVGYKCLNCDNRGKSAEE